MATENQTITTEKAGQFKLNVWMLCDSIHVGVLQENKNSDESAINSTFAIGSKQYEISNHLGNVLTTISDSKQAIDDGQGQVAYYKPIVKTQQDYYPFGTTIAILVSERQFTLHNDNYRFGFNGQERSDEVYGKGNLNTALFWEYDTRLGRRWNLDPVTKPWISSYHAFSNKPITFIDHNGDNANPIIDDETVDLIGMTSKKGDSNYNKILSEKRVSTVVNYLIKNGISADRINFGAVGEDSPFNLNDQEGSSIDSQEAKDNRRVVIELKFNQ